MKPTRIPFGSQNWTSKFWEVIASGACKKYWDKTPMLRFATVGWLEKNQQDLLPNDGLMVIYHGVKLKQSPETSTSMWAMKTIKKDHQIPAR